MEPSESDSLVTYRGTVYPWQCDHNGHMNVMFYAGKFDEASWQLLSRLGLSRSRIRQRAPHWWPWTASPVQAPTPRRRRRHHPVRAGRSQGQVDPFHPSDDERRDRRCRGVDVDADERTRRRDIAGLVVFVIRWMQWIDLSLTSTSSDRMVTTSPAWSSCLGLEMLLHGHQCGARLPDAGPG